MGTQKIRFLEYSKATAGSKMSFELWEVSTFEEDILSLKKVELMLD